MHVTYWGKSEWEEDSQPANAEPTEDQLAFDPELQIQLYENQPVTADDERFVRQFMADRLCSGL